MTDPENANNDDAPSRIRRRKLSQEEQKRLGEDAKPGAVYKETGWEKRSQESLRSIHQAIDELARTRAPSRALSEDLPPGLRSRVTSQMGPAAYVQRAYSTKRHHVLHVGLRQEGTIQDEIVLVGPDDLRRFDDIASAVDALRHDEHDDA